MKKAIALMLVLVFVLMISACASKDTVSDIDTSAPASSEKFAKPENYATVLLVSINPKFKLYLDETNKVLAVEPVNKDAKSFSKSIDFENKTVETVVENIVEMANKKGFIKEKTVVNFEITELKDGISRSDVLAKVVSAANQKAAELKLEIKTEIKESNNSHTTETNSENTQTESKATHTHYFSAATCTEPQTCTCGEIKGSALGHKWQEATCATPQTCSVCKETEGNIGNHKYNRGNCIYCDDKQIINPKEGIKADGYYYLCLKYNSGDDYLGVFRFEGSTMILINIFSDNENSRISDEKIIYNGKTYFHSAEGQGFALKYTLTDTEIIIKEQGQEAKMIVNYQYDLEVIYSTVEDIPAGSILDLVQ